jgi:peptide/nickel transport system permease protein
MTKYLLRRLIVSIPVLIGITMATYLIMNLAPGDPVDAMLNPEAIASLGPGWVEQQREALGLNDPIPIRYVKWVQQALEGNLGFSYIDRQPVADKVLDRIWPTLKLMLTVMIISLLIGVPIGIISAVKQYSFLDYFVTVTGLISVSIPAFFLALVLIYFFALRLDWLPATGMFTVGQERTFTDSLKHLILPATALGMAQAAPIIRYTRASLLEVISMDYTTVARAKGLTERAVIIRHALRNVLIPLVTVVALDIPRLLGGTVVIEQVFAWPGMGTLAITSVFGRDYPVLMAINLISAIMILASNLLADVVYALVDPRVKYS